jgi:hypothetical protein
MRPLMRVPLQGLKAATQTAGGLASLWLASAPLTGVLVLTLPAMYAAGSVYGGYLRRLADAARRAGTVYCARNAWVGHT